MEVRVMESCKKKLGGGYMGWSCGQMEDKIKLVQRADAQNEKDKWSR